MATLAFAFAFAFAFACVFIGFGIKSGMVPLHVRLPDVHPVAPSHTSHTSHISAMMSGAMIKMGIYGIVRVSYDLIGDLRWEWGMVVLVIRRGHDAVRRALRADAARPEAPARRLVPT